MLASRLVEELTVKGACRFLHRPARANEIIASNALIPPAETLDLQSLISTTAHGVSSRVLAKTAGGTVTLFAFDAGQELSEHSTPFDALALVLEGAVTLTIGGAAVQATPGTVVRMPANIPHAVRAPETARMLLIMLR